MNLFLHSVSSLSYLTFSSLKERTSPSITPRQKIITIIALAAFACVALVYVSYQYVFRKKDNGLKKGGILKVNQPEENIVQDNRENKQIQPEPEKNNFIKKDSPKIAEQTQNKHLSLSRSVYLTFLGIWDESKWLTEPQIELLAKKLKKWIAKGFYQEKNMTMMTLHCFSSMLKILEEKMESMRFN